MVCLDRYTKYGATLKRRQSVRSVHSLTVWREFDNGDELEV